MASRDSFHYRILVVDDDPRIRQTSAAILSQRGYEVKAAVDGFDALAILRHSLPDLIITDLGLPNMSGFEFLSVVRRRFPQLPIIVISGEFSATMPASVLADAFFKKGEYTPEELFRRIADLLEQSPIRPNVAGHDTAPVWHSTNGYYVLTCTHCLRSFSVATDPTIQGLQQADCTFCETMVRYVVKPGTAIAPRPVSSERSEQSTAEQNRRTG